MSGTVAAVLARNIRQQPHQVRDRSLPRFGAAKVLAEAANDLRKVRWYGWRIIFAGPRRQQPQVLVLPHMGVFVHARLASSRARQHDPKLTLPRLKFVVTGIRLYYRLADEPRCHIRHQSLKSLIKITLHDILGQDL